MPTTLTPLLSASDRAATEPRCRIPARSQCISPDPFSTCPSRARSDKRRRARSLHAGLPCRRWRLVCPSRFRSRHGPVNRISVHEPGHDLLVRAHVRAHDVGVRPDERNHLLHVTARNRFEFRCAKVWSDRTRFRLWRRRRANWPARISSSSTSRAPRFRPSTRLGAKRVPPLVGPRVR